VADAVMSAANLARAGHWVNSAATSGAQILGVLLILHKN